MNTVCLTRGRTGQVLLTYILLQSCKLSSQSEERSNKNTADFSIGLAEQLSALIMQSYKHNTQHSWLIIGRIGNLFSQWPPWWMLFEQNGFFISDTKQSFLWLFSRLSLNGVGLYFVVIVVVELVERKCGLPVLCLLHAGLDWNQKSALAFLAQIGPPKLLT